MNAVVDEDGRCATCRAAEGAEHDVERHISRDETGVVNKKEIAGAHPGLVDEARPHRGLHRAAQRIVTMTLAEIRMYLRRHPDELESLLALPMRGVIEERAVAVMKEELSRGAA